MNSNMLPNGIPSMLNDVYVMRVGMDILRVWQSEIDNEPSTRI